MTFHTLNGHVAPVDVLKYDHSAINVHAQATQISV
ncbi:MAG: hypothetical protein ETSY1_33455 [Candidatus Entotheonella factor]|uniref:Uncharacterized protein n=1 Tax=Entotheonella factor TaxID=1429438 RepID=W4LBR9_ENTF1|nr:MAG: hypothetical protein ETSY1_33455 [Candidatus Entotheonella factor]